MINSALLLCVLSAVCPPSSAVMTSVPDIDSCGYALIMEISGSAIENRAYKDLQPVSKSLPDGRTIEIAFQRVNADALSPCPWKLRIMGDLTVGVTEAGEKCCSSAKLIMGASLDVVKGNGTQLTLDIKAMPETLIVTSDACNSKEVEELIRQAAPEIASRLSVAFPLEGLRTLAQARPDSSPPIEADAYQLGFGWILRVYGASQETHAAPPSVFLQGNIFTLIVSKAMIQALAANQFASGQFPTAMNENGIVDKNGSIHITGVTVDLEPGILVINWLGNELGTGAVTVTWRLAFVTEVNELVLKIQQIEVNGQSKPIPDTKDLINPIDELIKNIAAGPATTTVFSGPMGRLRLTAGQIAPYGILVAGRV